jgi:caffeoyl-CoA O-methyltransferase
MFDELLYTYSEAHTTPEIPILARLNRETHLSQVYPQMLSGHIQGALLRMISFMISPARILEIGTFTGYSAINLAAGLCCPENPGSLQGDDSDGPRDAKRGLLHTIEVNPELEEMIRKFIREAGLDERIILHIGEALEIIPTLDETWDLVFIDADKPNYLNYYEMVLPRLRSGGFLIADNVLWDGKVLDEPEKMDKDTRGITQFNEFVHRDDRVEHMMLPVRDGLLICRKR